MPVHADALREQVLQRWQATRDANAAVLAAYREETLSAVAALGAAKAAIPQVLEDLTSYRNSARLAWLMALDKVRGGARAEAMIQASLERHMLPAVRAALHGTEVAGERLQARFEENQVRLYADLLSLVPPMAESTALPSYGNAVRGLSAAAAGSGLVATRSLAAGMGLAMEALFIRSTVRSAAVVLRAIVRRMAGTATAGVLSAGADGPFPVGDAIAVGLAVVGTAWAGMDLYRARGTLRREVNAGLQTALRHYESELHRAADRFAAETLRAYEEASRGVVESRLAALNPENRP
ncbi:MAG: hypothetical protein JXR77_11535 [Lentisphaeria bacterium]|nr:hypothetical protein [Lentisphaeria bacterium]